MKNALVVWPKDSVSSAGRRDILVLIVQSEVICNRGCIRLCSLQTQLKNRSSLKVLWLETLPEELALVKLMSDGELDLLRLQSKLEKREDSVRVFFELGFSVVFSSPA